MTTGWEDAGRQAGSQRDMVMLSLSDLDEVVRKDVSEVTSRQEEDRRRDVVKERCEAGLFLVFVASGFVLYYVRLDALVPYIAGLPACRVIIARIFCK